MPQTRHYEMKDSGVDWIGRMPDGWSRDKINRIYDVIGSGTTPKFDDAKDNSGPVNWIQSGDVYSGGSITKVKNQIAESFLSEYSALKLYQPPFVVIAMYGASIGNMAVSAISGCVNQACCVLGKPRGDFNYAYYALQALKKHLLSSALGGGQPNISQQIIKAQWLPMPPLSEQTAIAAYLDEKCAAIDAIIAEAKASIEEYKSWKASVIFETVTKGLNPNAEMKDSGVEWIGETPEHWTIAKQKYFVTLINGRAYADNEFKSDGKYRVLRVGNFFTNSSWYYSDLELESDKYCDDGDLLYAWSASYGPKIWDGGKVIYHYHIWKCKLGKAVDRMFCYYYYLALGQFVANSAHGTAMMHITMQMMNNAFMPIPPLPEQTAIASYLDSKCAAIDGIILEKEELIRELENYKRSLIFEVVTGKRRVC